MTEGLDDATAGHHVPGPLNLSRNRNTAPIHAPWDHPALDEGMRLFNQGEHWHAHEALEPLWMGLEGQDKLFVQGIIMAAAMLVQYGKKVPRGVANHWANVTLRLRPHEPSKWGIDVTGLLRQLEAYANCAAKGNWELSAKAAHIKRRTG